MLSGNILLVLLIIGGGLIGLAIFFVACLKGLFDDTQAQSTIIFNQVDLRIKRPWETAKQAQERRELFGELIEPKASEWGGAR